MSKKIIICGMGKLGKPVIDFCISQKNLYELSAIIDNGQCGKTEVYRGVPVIGTKELNDFVYDQIWICSRYYREIKKQLTDEMNVSSDRITYMEYPLIELEGPLREKYKDVLSSDGCKCMDPDKQKVLDHLKNHPLRMFNYDFYEEAIEQDTPVYFDEEAGMYYGYYQGHKIYLKRSYNSYYLAQWYLNMIIMEQGKGSPHNYFTDAFILPDDSIGIDVGAAEGIFGLKIIDRVKRLYLVEENADWCEALRYTYAPFEDRVEIVQKYAGTETGGNTVRLDDLADRKGIDFIKMDVEGAEPEVLKGAEGILEKGNPSLAVCTYHNENDEITVTEMLKEKGYVISMSRGYLVCAGEWELETMNPDFRRAVCFANKLREDNK